MDASAILVRIGEFSFVLAAVGLRDGIISDIAYQAAVTCYGLSRSRLRLTVDRHQEFRWYDLRHTWASWLVQEGVPLHILQELSGWESAEMVRRYAHLSSDHLADYASRLATLSVVKSFDTKVAQG